MGLHTFGDNDTLHGKRRSNVRVMGQQIVYGPGFSDQAAAAGISPCGQAFARPVRHAGTVGGRARLKAATGATHRGLDHTLSALDLTDPQGYRRFLTIHAMVLPACEAVLAVSNAALLLPDWPARVRAPSLADDLAAAGVAADFAAASGATPVGPAAAFGMMYVLEGSRLGGAVLARRVDGNADPACRGATRYLRHGAGQGLWPSFVTAIDAAECVADDIGAAIAAALHVFALFETAARPFDAAIPQTPSPPIPSPKNRSWNNAA